MSWLFAPDSYGGFCSAPAALSMAEGLGWAGHPMSDGGEGLLDALRWHRSDLAIRSTPATGPCGRRRDVSWLQGPTSRIIESALVVGPTGGHACDALSRSSAGLGALLGTGAGPTVVGLGGSATVDGGIGMAVALGMPVFSLGQRLRRANGYSIRRPLVAASARIDLSSVEVWCDVQTPLAESMARFGPQKGLDDYNIRTQGRAVVAWAVRLNDLRTRRRQAPLPLDLAGGGAAGGLGFALAALGARLRPGAAAFADMTGLDEAIALSDGVILGEGRLDAGSFDGKVAGEVCARARRAGKPVAALVGRAASLPPGVAGPDIVVEVGDTSEAAFRAAAARLAKELG